VIQLPTGKREFSLLGNVKAGSGAHTVSLLMGTCGFLPSGKTARE